MSTQLEFTLLKKTPCNGCRERKRKCSYEQPCARCINFGIDCIYTVMPSPKDIEYIQELEYIKQIEQLQRQILSMEEEMGILKLAQENNKHVNESPSPQLSTTSTSPTISPISPPTIYNDDANIYHDYPSPISVSTVHERFQHKNVCKRRLECEKNLRDLVSNSALDYVRPQGIVNHVLCHGHPLDDKNKVKLLYNELFRSHNTDYQHQVKQLFKIEDVEATLSKQQQQQQQQQHQQQHTSWTLTVKNGNISIETHIKNHSDLMRHLEGMVSTSYYHKMTNTIPFHLTTIDVPEYYPKTGVGRNSIGVVLSIMMWRKYGKSRFISMTKYTPTLMHYEKSVHKIQPVPNIAHITMRLIHAFLQCLHLKFIHLHAPTFIRLFIKDEQHVMSSPVVMAFASLVAHCNCKHITAVIPQESLNDYGLFYYERARELIEEEFDQVNLETLFTFTFMAAYHMKIKEDDTSNKYLCMAERVYSSLLPQYQFVNGKPNSDEAILFSRLYRVLYHTRSVLKLHEMMHMFKARERGRPQQMFKLLDHQDELDTYIAYDDTPKEVAFIKMQRYLIQLRQNIGEAGRYAAAADFPTYVSVFGHHIEMAMRHWYRNILPVEFQLSLPLFEDDTPDIEFFIKLEMECSESPIAILTTLSLYNEYLIMAKSYLPKEPDELQVNTEDLLQRYKEMTLNIPLKKNDTKFNEKTLYWIHMLERMMHVRQYHKDHFTTEELDEPEEEYFTKFINALNPSKINFDMPFIHTSIRTALNMVRIIQFLITRDYSCYLDLRWVMNCWDVLLRAARFKYKRDEQVTLDRIRANLLLCIKFAQTDVGLSHYRRGSTGDMVKVMQQDFDNLF